MACPIMTPRDAGLLHSASDVRRELDVTERTGDVGGKPVARQVDQLDAVAILEGIDLRGEDAMIVRHSVHHDEPGRVRSRLDYRLVVCSHACLAMLSKSPKIW